MDNRIPRLVFFMNICHSSRAPFICSFVHSFICSSNTQLLGTFSGPGTVRCWGALVPALIGAPSLAMKRRSRKAIDYYITITIVLHRNEEQGIRAHDRQNLTFSWGAVLTKVMSALKLDTGGGLS